MNATERGRLADAYYHDGSMTKRRLADELAIARSDIEDLLAERPTQCKDCFYISRDGWCTLLCITPRPDFYCKSGRPRDGDKNGNPA